MSIFRILLCLGGTLQLCSAFVQLSESRGVVCSGPFSSSYACRPNRSTPALKAANYEDVADVGYGVTVQKPMGVIFGENREPYFGLVVDDIAEGLNGGKAGLRVGDQLLAVNGKVVVGKDFDSVMDLLAGSSSSQLDLILYRGPVSQLFTILSNRVGEDEAVVDDEDLGDEPVIMDENYVSPVVIEVKEQKPLTPGDFLKALVKVGSMLTVESGDDDDDDDTTQKQAPPKKKNTGFFGIGGEAIFLDGDDAKTLK
jgi:hypothetical protein